jgi:hypothetical protein
MAHYYSLQLLCFVVIFAGLTVYYPLTFFDEIQCEVGEPILLPGYPDTVGRGVLSFEVAFIERTGDVHPFITFSICPSFNDQ